MKAFIFSGILIGAFMMACSSTSNESAGTDQAVDSLVTQIGKFDLRIALPPGWSEITGQNNISYKKDCSEEVKFCSNLTIRTFPYQDNLALDSLAETFIHSIISAHAGSTLVRNAPGAIGNEEGRMVDVMLPEESMSLGSSFAVMSIDDKLVVVGFMALNEPEGIYTEKEEEFTEMLNSLTVTPR